MLTRYQPNVAVFMDVKVEDMQTRYDLVGFLSANEFMTRCFLLYPIFINMEVYILLTGRSLLCDYPAGKKPTSCLLIVYC